MPQNVKYILRSHQLMRPAFIKEWDVFTFNTHWGRGKWPPYYRRHFQIHFLNENVWILIKISLKFVPRSPLTIFHHWFRKWLGADQATSHYLNQWVLVYRRIYASLGLNELTFKYIANRTECQPSNDAYRMLKWMKKYVWLRLDDSRVIKYIMVWNICVEWILFTRSDVRPLSLLLFC